MQGDVIGIVDNNGIKVVEYTYDEWGKPLTVTGTLATTIGELNPFRYRGYYYDTETGFYYCQSRYYDPEIGRWINADGLISGIGGDIRGYNLFAYCFNNPINLEDSEGNLPKWLKKAAKVVAAVAVAVVAVVTAVTFAPVAVGVGTTSGIIGGTAIAKTGALALGIVGTAAVVKEVVESNSKKTDYRDNSVYIMRDKSTNDVGYVGRTNEPARRTIEHSCDPSKDHLYPLEVVVTGLTKQEARVVEQILISAYALENLDNARREISKKNLPGFCDYMHNFITLFEGATSDDLFDLMGR